MRGPWSLIALMLLTCSSAFAQDVEQKRPPPREAGSQQRQSGQLRTETLVRGSAYVGESAPDFELDASDGTTLRLSQLNGQWVLLAFGERKEHLAHLQAVQDSVKDLNMRVVGVCDEKAHHLRRYAGKERAGLTLLADVTGEISALYGLYDALRSTTAPGFFVIDEDGVVRMGLLGKQVGVADMASLARFAVTGL